MIYQLLAALLHLCNLSFQKDMQRNGAALIGNKDVLEISSTLLQVEESVLETALCNRNMSARAQSVYTIPLKVEEANSNRDALVKSVYAR